jgi:hypothetical protein
MIDPDSVAAAGNGELVSNELQRIYYINLAKNTKRRDFMETWLSRRTIPFFRIEASHGSENPKDCVEGKQNPERCRGMSGLVKTVVGIIHNHNTSGLSLVLEDDFIVTPKLSLRGMVKRALRYVPPDWDIIRFNCWGKVPSSFDFVLRKQVTVFKTAHQRPCKAVRSSNTNSCECNFCGGTHAMLWRDASLKKLEGVWMKQPFDDIDIRLTSEKLNSYCVNLGSARAGKLVQPKDEKTDIPKMKG